MKMKGDEPLSTEKRLLITASTQTRLISVTPITTLLKKCKNIVV
jgi:hypothetical protein